MKIKRILALIAGVFLLLTSVGKSFSTAKRILHDGAPNYSSYGGYGYKNLVYHTFTVMQRAIYGWNHYHMGMYNSLDEKTKLYDNKHPMHKVHCFFGLTYIRLPDNQGFESYPTHP